ncbi:LysR family transcriptional regulator [Tistrella bauzanensis]|uniref:LysR family transcriptional regulator n=1 Tax=Tistrella bauzanensis TaxID=657419 RepID=A0ABQ1IHN3_9PROT|nr:LysR family transcriptional regulator [Tistrella bauzanensis]GGB42021.1 LysR family transcriptional regulator [Tistrella bauzanensis]
MNGSDPSWDLYRTFLAVLREGSLSAAARALGLTQPTIGRHVDALEQAVGVQLFTRSLHGLQPTEAALDLKPYAETLAATTAALLRAASGPGDRVAGVVRVTASEVVGVEVLPPVVAALQARHPDLVIELELSNALEDLLRRDADIAVRMVVPTQDALVVRRLGVIALGLHAHRHYLDRHGTPMRIEDLARHRVIGFDRETHAIRRMRRGAGSAAGALDRSRFAVRSDSDLAQLAAIRAGCGIGICQVPLAARDPRLVRVLGDAVDLPLETFLAMHETLRDNRRCRVMFDALAQGLMRHIAGRAPVAAVEEGPAT